MASSSDSSAQALSLAAAYLPYNGSILIAVNAAWLLYGCLLVQIYHYFSSHSSKDYWLKYLVGAVTVAGGLHVGFGCATQWGVLVEHWGDPGIWTSTPWESALGPFTSGLNGVLVQLFFVGRILMLSKKAFARIAAGMITMAALLAFGGSIAVMILFLKGGSNALEILQIQTVTRLWTITTVICDVLIAGTMSIILSLAHSKTTFKATCNLLTRLMLQAIETGTVTAVDMLLCLICYETMQSNSAYMVWEFSSGPLYGNVLVFVLNSRQQHIDRTLTQKDVHTLSDMTHSSRDHARTALNSKVGTAVKVTTDVLTQVDVDRKDLEVGTPAGYTRPHAYAQ